MKRYGSTDGLDDSDLRIGIKGKVNVGIVEVSVVGIGMRVEYKKGTKESWIDDTSELHTYHLVVFCE